MLVLRLYGLMNCPFWVMEKWSDFTGAAIGSFPADFNIFNQKEIWRSPNSPGAGKELALARLQLLSSGILILVTWMINIIVVFLWCWQHKHKHVALTEIHRDLMQRCYPRTYRPQLTEDIFRQVLCSFSFGDQEAVLFRMYDMDNDGTIDFKVF